MSNTTICDGKTIHITFDGTTAWNFASELQAILGPQYTNGVMLKSIQFLPSATDDAVIVRNVGTADQTSGVLFEALGSSKYAHIPMRFDPPRLCKPSIHGSDVTGTCKIIMEIE